MLKNAKKWGVRLIIATSTPLLLASCFGGNLHKDIVNPMMVPQMVCTPASDNLSKALYIKQLETDLMVGALGCHSKAKYTAFVKKYRTELDRNSNYIRDSYKHKYHSSYRRHMSKIVTKMANNASRRSIMSSNFCTPMNKIYGELLGSSKKDIASYARTYYGAYVADPRTGQCKPIAR